jgi:hypothetical protein
MGMRINLGGVNYKKLTEWNGISFRQMPMLPLETQEKNCNLTVHGPRKTRFDAAHFLR